MDQPGARLDQRAEQDDLEGELERRRAQRLEQEVGWHRAVEDGRVMSAHGNEEQEPRQDGDATGGDPGAHRLASGLYVVEREEDGGDDRQVISGVANPAHRPGGAGFAGGEGRADLGRELDERPDEDGQIDGVENERPESQRPLDGGAAAKDQEPHRPHDAQHTQRVGEREGLAQDRARGRGDDREDDGEQCEVANLVKKPGRAQQVAEEAAVVVGAKHSDELEARRADGAPDERRHDDRQQAAAGSVAEEELHQLATGAVAARDDHRLEDEAGQQVFFEEGGFAHRSGAER